MRYINGLTMGLQVRSLLKDMELPNALIGSLTRRWPHNSEYIVFNQINGLLGLLGGTLMQHSPPPYTVPPP